MSKEFERRRDIDREYEPGDQLSPAEPPGQGPAGPGPTQSGPEPPPSSHYSTDNDNPNYNDYDEHNTDTASETQPDTSDASHTLDNENLTNASHHTDNQSINHQDEQTNASNNTTNESVNESKENTSENNSQNNESGNDDQNTDQQSHIERDQKENESVTDAESSSTALTFNNPDEMTTAEKLGSTIPGVSDAIAAKKNADAIRQLNQAHKRNAQQEVERISKKMAERQAKGLATSVFWSLLPYLAAAAAIGILAFGLITIVSNIANQQARNNQAATMALCENENDTDSASEPGDSTSSGTATSDLGHKENIKPIYDHLHGEYGLSAEMVAGILGNWYRESQINPASAFPSLADEAAIKAVDTSTDIQTGSAVGLGQWLGNRRQALMIMAKEEKAKWYDLDLQLNFMTSKDPAISWLVDYANKATDDPAQNAKLFHDIWERGGQAESAKALTFRGEPAKRILEYMKKEGMDGSADKEKINKIQGGNSNLDDGIYSGAESTSEEEADCGSGGDSNFDTSSVAKLAIDLAYPLNDNGDDVPAGDSYGKTNAPPKYKAAKAKAEKKTGPDGIPGLYASCDRFVATVIKNTVDPKIPWGSTTEQQTYLSQSKKWKQYTKKKDAKPGDIFVTKTNGHVLIYVGKYKGKDLIAHASYLDRVGGLDESSYISEDMVDLGGRAYYGYHYIGD